MRPIDPGTRIKRLCLVVAVTASIHAAAFAAGPLHYTGLDIVGDAGPLASDRFGEALALDGDTLVVVRGDGNPADGVDRQAILVHRREAAGWRFEAELRPHDRLPLDLREAVVAVSGAFVVIGAPRGGDTEEGRAFLWERSQAGSWRQVRVLKSSQPSRYARFGSAVDIDDNTIVVGSPFELGPDGGGAGAAHVFQRGSTGWRHARSLLPPASPALQAFGDAVSIDNSRILVGAPLSAGLDGSVATGASVVFSRNAGGSGRWGAIAQLRRPQGLESAQCGRSVAIAGHRAAIGCENAREVWLHRIGSARAPLRLGDAADERFFGSALDLRLDRLVVSAAGLRTDIESRVLVYDCPDAAPLACTPYDTLAEAAGRHGYGRSLAIDEGGRIAVGFDDEGGEFLAGGAVFVHDEP